MRPTNHLEKFSDGYRALVYRHFEMANDDDREAHEAVKERLNAIGLSLSSIAAELNVAQPSVSMVSRNLHRSQRIEERIAKRLGTTPAELWPRKFNRKSQEKEERKITRG